MQYVNTVTTCRNKKSPFKNRETWLDAIPASIPGNPGFDQST
jgi:hypothetical protein